MTVIGRHEGKHPALKMQGLVHEMRVMAANSQYDPVLIEIQRAGEEQHCLLDQEDVDALHEFLSRFATPLAEREKTTPEQKAFEDGCAWGTEHG